MAVLEKMGTPPETIKEITDVSGKIRKMRFRETKLFKSSNLGRAAVAISPDIVDISAPDADDSSNTVGVSVIGNSGTVIRGPLGITGTPSTIRIAGMWKFNDVLLSAAPSTILTPIPVLRFSLPLSSVADFFQTATAIGAVAGLI